MPKVHKDLTSLRVLTMEFIHGVKLSEIDELKKAGFNLDDITKAIIEATAEQIFMHGFVHADPHAGNIFVRPAEGRRNFQIVLIDHGLYKELSNKTRTQFARMWRAIVLDDVKSMKSIGLEMGIQRWNFLASMIAMRPVFDPEQEPIRDHQEFVDIVLDTMAKMPPELTLIFRNQAYVRTLNKRLAPKVNRHSIMARTAAKSIDRDTGVSGRFRLSWIHFELSLFYSELRNWFSEFLMRMMTGFSFEDIDIDPDLPPHMQKLPPGHPGHAHGHHNPHAAH